MALDMLGNTLEQYATEERDTDTDQKQRNRLGPAARGRGGDWPASEITCPRIEGPTDARDGDSRSLSLARDNHGRS